MEGGENGKMASPKDPKEFKRPDDIIPGEGTNPVSYTHLDVYKRQSC